jgi:segregation and condensation protein A
MPFAMVNGEPMTELPKDLYIPPQALEVFLEAFEGPLDLLLYLIRRQNLDVLDIPIAEITRQYMKYIEVMTEMQLELAGEYMVMAATLAEIKSRMLLPRAHVVDGTEEDPRAELVRRLQEYERFKAAAENIDRLERLERDTWSASAELKDRKVVRLMPDVTLKEMLLAFKDVVVRSEMFAHHHIQRERLSIRQRMSDIVSTLEHASFVEFQRLFRPEEGRMGVTVTFVAILELVREGLIEIVQTEPFAPLHVRPAGAHRGLRLVANNERGEEEVAVNVTPVDEGPSADELLLKSTEPFEDDDDFDEEDLPLEGVDDVVVNQVSRAPEVGASLSAVVTDDGNVGVSTLEEAATAAEPVELMPDDVGAIEMTSGPVLEEVAAVEVIGEPVSDEVAVAVLTSEWLPDGGNAAEVIGEPSPEEAVAVEVIDEQGADEGVAADSTSEPASDEAGVVETMDEQAAVIVEQTDPADAAVVEEADVVEEAEEAVQGTNISEDTDVDEVSDVIVTSDSDSTAEAAATPATIATFEAISAHEVAADETHEAADELSASDEPNESDESGDVDEPNEFSGKPPAGGTSG